MPYSQPDEVRAVLARDSSVVAGTGAELDDAALTMHIASADAQIDAMLNPRYDLPFEVVPETVKYLSIDIAAFLADITYRQHKDYSSELDPIYLRYQRALNMLTALNTGAATIDVDTEDDSLFMPSIINSAPKMFGMAEFGLVYDHRGTSIDHDPDFYRR